MNYKAFMDECTNLLMQAHYLSHESVADKLKDSQAWKELKSSHKSIGLLIKEVEKECA